jgi:hypothetical protein
VTMTDVSGFPHVTIARDRDNAVSAFLRYVYMFANVHKGRYTVVGNDHDPALRGLHLLYTPMGDETTICVVSVSCPMEIIPQEPWQTPSYRAFGFSDLATEIQASVERNEPNAAEASRLERSVVAWIWPRALADMMMEANQPSEKEWMRIPESRSKELWAEMSSVRQWTQGKARVSAGAGMGR